MYIDAMKKNQNGFHVIEFLIVILVVGFIGFAGWHVLKKNRPNENSQNSQQNNSGQGGVQEGNGPNYKALAKCSSKAILNTVPTTLSDFDQIIPLGNIGVPDHTLPTDHLYFAFKHIGSTVTNPVLNSPGQIVVTSIMYSGEKINGVSRSDDYDVIFSACKGVMFNFGHVQALAGKLQDSVKNQDWDKPCEKHTPAAGEETFYCTKSLDIVLTPGEQIGMVGGKPQLGAFDFGAHDASYKDPGYINTDWYPTANAVCGLDYFESSAKTQLYSLVKRTQEPRCGQIGQDKANTAQGSWFATQDRQQGFNNWNMGLSFVHNNIYPDVGVLAVGGTVSSPSLFTFSPKQSGNTNREPSDIKANGQVYCIQNESTSVQNSTPGTGKVLVQLINNTTLKVEYQTGSCAGSESFSNPTTYYR